MTVNRNLNAPSYEIQDYQSTIQDNEPLSSSFLRVTAVDADVQVWTSVKLVRARLHRTSESTLWQLGMMLGILFSLKTMESPQNGFQPHSGVTPLFSVKTLPVVSWLSCRSIDADARCKRALNQSVIRFTLSSKFTREIGKLSGRPKKQHFLWVVFSVTTQWSDVHSDRRQHSHGILHGKSQHRTYQSEEIRSAGSRTQNYVQSTSIGARQRRADHKSCYQQVCMNLGSTKFYINTLFNIGKDVISVITTGWARELAQGILFTILRDVHRFCYVQGEYKSNSRT